MPKDGEVTKIITTTSMTVLIAGNNKLYYYFGPEEEPFKTGSIKKATWDGQNSIRSVISGKKLELTVKNINTDKLMALLKHHHNQAIRTLYIFWMNCSLPT